jgi:uncharacterized membrane protein
MELEKCFITGKLLNIAELVSASTLRKNMIEFIRKDFPDFNSSSFICIDALHDYRKRYLENVLTGEIGRLDKVEHEVVEAIAKHEIVSENIDITEDEQLTFGQRLADRVATFGGSWEFIILFSLIIFFWIVVNSVFFVKKGFDPYPYILLNLILSCIAALQAPVIMMSQNRRDTKDRKRNEHDYKVNLKAELEIRMLHDKIDQLMSFQTQKIMELQEMQMDYLEELSASNRSKERA